jgi:nicotinate-nucleotide pyrophosphorylase (carboxylating)
MTMPSLTPAIATLIDLALEEDLGRGDVTSAAVLAPGARAEADLVAREPLVVAGLEVAAAVFRRVDPALAVTLAVADGHPAAAGSTLASVSGPAASLLAAERTALNFLQRLCGVATATRAFVDAAAGSGLRVTDTRKTTPGFRLLEKQAVRAGGGANHRFDLGSGVLIKDNHLAVAGSVREAIRRARLAAPHGLRVEVEVDTLTQLDEALDAGADIVLLDNFTLPQIEEGVRRVRARTPRPLVEVSGGVTLARLPELARTGVDLVSVGALTHSARAVDIGLDVRMVGR